MCARTRLVNAHKWHIQAQLQTTTRKTCTSIALDLDLVSLCDKKRRMAGGFPTSFQFRFPMFDTISRTAVTGHGDLMVARLLGTNLNFGVPLCYALLLFW